MAQRPIVETRSGIGINLINPDPETITLEDIAYGLSHQCRFGGHVRHFYSVAEHTLLCADLSRDFSLEEQRSIFLHDAHEAYLGDIPTPIKRMLSDFSEIINRFDEAIQEKFNLAAGFDFERLKEVDHLALSIEAKELMAFREENWYDGGISDNTPEVVQFEVVEGRHYQFGQEHQPNLIRDLFLSKAKSLSIE